MNSKHESEAKHTRCRLSPASTLEEVDAWLKNYLAVVDEARREALRQERLNAAAEDLLKAAKDALGVIRDLTPSARYCDRVVAVEEALVASILKATGSAA